MQNPKASLILAPVFLVLVAMFGLGCGGNDSTVNPLDPDCCVDRPMLSGITPNRIAFGDTGVVVILDGANFSENSVALWNDTALPTTYFGYNLEVRLRDDDLIRPDLPEVETIYVEMKVWNQTEDLPMSESRYLQLSEPADPPVITHMEPDTFLVETESTSVIIYGTGFERDCQLLWGDQVFFGQYLGDDLLRISIPDSALGHTGTFSVSVANNLGRIPSNSLTAEVLNPQPTWDQYFPPHLTAGDGDQIMTCTGSGFTANTIIHWNGQECEVTYHTDTAIKFVIEEEYFSTAGSGTLSLHTPEPGGGQVEPIEVLIIQFIDETTHEMIFDPQRQLLYVLNSRELLKIDPVTGNVLNRIATVDYSNKVVSMTDDGNYLYIGSEGSRRIKRIPLFEGGQTFVVETPGQVKDILTLAGTPGSVAIISYDPLTEPYNSIYIYDDDVMRPQRGPTDGSEIFVTSSHITRTNDSDVIVTGAYGFEGDERYIPHGMKHIQMAPDGARVNDLSHEGIMGEDFGSLVYHDGLIYCQSGLVVHEATFQEVFRFEKQAITVIDGDASQIYRLTDESYPDGLLSVYSLDTRELLMEIPLDFSVRNTQMVKAGADVIVINSSGPRLIRHPFFTGNQ